MKQLRSSDMFPELPELSISLPSKTGLLKMIVELTRHVSTLNSFTEKEAQKLSLAVDEAITNVIKHSYNYKQEEIEVKFFCIPEGVKIVVVFTGAPPELKDAKVDLEQMIKDKKKSGLGVSLIRKIMDDVKYYTDEDGINYCEMIKWKKSD